MREIVWPEVASVRVEVDGAEMPFLLDGGVVELAAPPVEGASVTAGFEFDVPVRFASDELIVSLSAFAAGEVPSIPLIEVLA